MFFYIFSYIVCFYPFFVYIFYILCIFTFLYMLYFVSVCVSMTMGFRVQGLGFRSRCQV